MVMEELARSVPAKAESLSVLFVVDAKFPGRGGAESQARKLAQALSKKDVDVKFVSPQISIDQQVQDTVDGFPSHRIRYPRIKLLGAIILQIRFAWYLIKHRHDYDAVHVHITRLFAATAVATRFIHRKAVIAKVSGFFEFEGGILDRSARFSPGNALLRFALRKIDYVQTISAETEQKLRSAGFSAQQIRLIPNGIDTQLVNPDEVDAPPKPLTFGYCGRLRSVKGIYVLMDAFTELAKANPKGSFVLRVAGGGRALDTLRKLTRDRGLTDRIEWLDTIDNTEKFYREIDVHIQPSFAEGLPNSVMEAMAASLPVLATDIGGNSDLITHGINGWLFPSGSSEELTVLMQRCIDAPELLASLGTQGRMRIERDYDIAAITNDLMDLYRGR